MPDGTHRFARLVERAPMRHHSWIVSREFAGSARAVLDGSRSWIGRSRGDA